MDELNTVFGDRLGPVVLLLVPTLMGAVLGLVTIADYWRGAPAKANFIKHPKVKALLLFASGLLLTQIQRLYSDDPSLAILVVYLLSYFSTILLGLLALGALAYHQTKDVLDENLVRHGRSRLLDASLRMVSSGHESFRQHLKDIRYQESTESTRRRLDWLYGSFTGLIECEFDFDDPPDVEGFRNHAEKFLESFILQVFRVSEERFFQNRASIHWLDTACADKGEYRLLAGVASADRRHKIEPLPRESYAGITKLRLYEPIFYPGEDEKSFHKREKSSYEGVIVCGLETESVEHLVVSIDSLEEYPAANHEQLSALVSILASLLETAAKVHSLSDEAIRNHLDG